jgi:hypothetical protein
MKTPPDLMTFLIMFRITQTVEALEVVDEKFYTSKEIAAIAKRSLKWVEKWRHKIIGAVRHGREWRFKKDVVDARVNSGRDVRVGIK